MLANAPRASSYMTTGCLGPRFFFCFFLSQSVFEFLVAVLYYFARLRLFSLDPFTTTQIGTSLFAAEHGPSKVYGPDRPASFFGRFDRRNNRFVAKVALEQAQPS